MNKSVAKEALFTLAKNSTLLKSTHTIKLLYLYQVKVFLLISFSKIYMLEEKSLGMILVVCKEYFNPTKIIQYVQYQRSMVVLSIKMYCSI